MPYRAFSSRNADEMACAFGHFHFFLGAIADTTAECDECCDGYHGCSFSFDPACCCCSETELIDNVMTSIITISIAIVVVGQ